MKGIFNIRSTLKFAQLVDGVVVSEKYSAEKSLKPNQYKINS
jgi:hypothetical protein